MPNNYYCRMCGSGIDEFAYSNAIFCSDRCRVRYFRERALRKPKISVKGVTDSGSSS